MSLTFSYGFKEGKIPSKDESNRSINYMDYKGNDFPISMDPLDFGVLMKTINIPKGKIYVLHNSKGHTITITKFDNYNEVEIFKNRKFLIKFIDEILSINSFVRIIGNKKFYFENNKEILFSREINTKFISKTNKSNNLVNNFISLDIETYIEDNILTPYCISIYDGNNKTSFCIWEFKNVEEMIMKAIESIMLRKYDRYNVYVHNLAKFDIFFLLKYLNKLGTVNPIIHNNRIIYVKFNFGKDNQYQIQFKDSFLILLSSLNKLSKSFAIKNPKTIFPYLFPKKDNLDYIGKVPDFKYFDNKISKSEYRNYKSQYSNN
jgi:uncharacterized protein YvpB